MWSIRSRNENEKLRVRDKLAARGGCAIDAFSLLCSIDRWKIKVSAL